MASMDYCKFRNCVEGMEQCIEGLEEGEADITEENAEEDEEPMSEEERDALKQMIRLCRRVVDEFGHYEEDD